jgi:hypothetical protein
VIAKRPSDLVQRAYGLSKAVVRHREALVALALAEIGLRTLPLPVLAKLFGFRLNQAPRSSTDSNGAPSEKASVKANAVARVARRWPFRNTCLRRSVALGLILRSERPVLRLGVVRTETGVRGHAWLELAGRPIGPHDIGEALPLRGPNSGQA